MRGKFNYSNEFYRQLTCVSFIKAISVVLVGHTYHHNIVTCFEKTAFSKKVTNISIFSRLRDRLMKNIKLQRT